MRKVRKGKSDDQENVKKALHLLQDLVHLNSDIEIPLWYAAFLSALVRGFKNNGLTFSEFRKEMDKAFDYYEKQYNKNDP